MQIASHNQTSLKKNTHTPKPTPNKSPSENGPKQSIASAITLVRHMKAFHLYFHYPHPEPRGVSLRPLAPHRGCAPSPAANGMCCPHFLRHSRKKYKIKTNKNVNCVANFCVA